MATLTNVRADKVSVPSFLLHPLLLPHSLLVSPLLLPWWPRIFPWILPVPPFAEIEIAVRNRPSGIRMNFWFWLWTLATFEDLSQMTTPYRTQAANNRMRQARTPRLTADAAL